MIKLIALDMDGTLLNSQTEVSRESAAAVKAAQEQGIEVIVCTGRYFSGVTSILNKAGIRCGGICMSGAAVYDAAGRASDLITIEPEELKVTLDTFRKYGLYSDIMTGDGIYSIDSAEMSRKRYEEMLGMFHGLEKESMGEEIERLLKRITHVKDQEALLAAGVDIYKIVSFHENLDVVEEVKKILADVPGLSAVSSFPNDIEVTNSRAEKGRVLKLYAERRRIKMEEVMAVGDSENDLSMLEMDFGCTVAMGNASVDIKKVAKYETLTNNEDGAAYAIRKWALR